MRGTKTIRGVTWLLAVGLAGSSAAAAAPNPAGARAEGSDPPTSADPPITLFGGAPLSTASIDESSEEAGGSGAKAPDPTLSAPEPTGVDSAVESATPGDADRGGERLILRKAGSERSAGIRSAGNEVKTVGEPSGWFSLRDFVPLLVVLGLIGLLAWLVKRFTPKRHGLTGAGVLDVVARLSLSPKQGLVLVKIGRKLVLMGTTPDRISALTVLDDPNQVAELIGEAARDHGDSMTRAFADSIDAQAEVYRTLPASGDPVTAARGHVRGLVEKVRRMTNRRDVA